MRIPAAILAATLFAASAHAADPRLRTINFETDKVVQLQGRLGYQSMIEFGPGEQIENVAVGDSSAWQVTPNKRANLLFLKPIEPKAKTNMTVITDQRVYLFDLSVASASSTALYNLRFTYDPPRQQSRVPYPKLLNDAPPPLAAAAATAQAARPARAGSVWKGKGKKDILPARYYDDGSRLYLQWAAGKPMPALFTRDQKGEELPANATQVGGFIVVDHVPRELVMRIGKRTAVLVNKNPVRPMRVAER
jgi:type IV secretion system protein VirB9